MSKAAGSRARRRARDAVALFACVAIVIGGTTASSPSTPTLPQRSTTDPVLSARQAEGVRAIVEFVDAFNSRDLGRAIRQFTRDDEFVRFVGGSDCDYRREKAYRFSGKVELSAWLRERFADRDTLALGTIGLLGERGARLTYRRRASRALRELGYANGLSDGLGAKVGFTTRGPLRLTQVAMAGSDDACQLP